MAAPARVRNRSVERRKKLQGGHPTGWAEAGVTSTRPSLEGQGLRTRPSAHIGGVPDAPMRVYTAGLKGALVWRSFHKAAGYTIEETTTKPVHMARCESPEV